MTQSAGLRSRAGWPGKNDWLESMQTDRHRPAIELHSRASNKRVTEHCATTINQPKRPSVRTLKFEHDADPFKCIANAICADHVYGDHRGTRLRVRM
jgi:hypothetical protein